MSAPQPDSASVLLSSRVPYAVAIGLMIFGVAQSLKIHDLKSQLLAADTDAARLKQSNTLVGLHLTTLEAREFTYASAQVVVAWDSDQHRGILSMQNLPAPPPGHDYQLWVLDPAAETPLNAGLITTPAGSRSFAVGPISTPTPGFAITLEPGGGSPAPTGIILFAVAPIE